MATTIPNPELIRQSVARYFEATRSGDARQWASRFLMQSLMGESQGAVI